jgi:hypothetical protein
MDPDQVRAMAKAASQTSQSLHNHMSLIVSTARGADWQSQAREEFMDRLESLSRITAQSMIALQLMGNAATQKANQWEAKANRFGSSLESIGSLWSSFLDNLNNTWQGLLDSIGKVAIGGIAVIVGGIGTIGGWIEKIPFPWERTGTPAPYKIAPDPEPDPAEPAPAPAETAPVEAKPYPQPPNQVNLKDTNDVRSCARYAAARRPDLGSTSEGLSKEAYKEKYPGNFEYEAAANYRHKFADKAYQIGEGEKGNLKDAIGVGYAITWDPGYKSNSTYGHVAIVEKVHDNYITISEASKVNGIYVYRTRDIQFDELDNQNVWLIP